MPSRYPPHGGGFPVRNPKTSDEFPSRSLTGVRAAATTAGSRALKLGSPYLRLSPVGLTVAFFGVLVYFSAKLLWVIAGLLLLSLAGRISGPGRKI
jgi:hypothetical protein